ncbi:MAG TPA: hypothetical protein VHW06_20860 [Streptosporangiaceae bacterium]|nr:hypothetical protein [Streptosporangiaceae bacterium]
MSRSGRPMLAIAAIMVVAVIAACTQKAMQKAATAGDASAGASTARPIAAASATPATSAALSTLATPAGTRTPTVASAAPTSPAPAAGASPSGTRYTNARFGFSFRVPPGYQAQSPPVDGDGLSFANPARTATVTAYGASNIGRYSPAQEMAQLVKTYQSARDTISYRFFHDDVIAVSGTTPRGAVFYQREVVYPAVIYTLLWSYPAATEAQYATLVTQTVDSFVPGPDHSG